MAQDIEKIKIDSKEYSIRDNTKQPTLVSGTNIRTLNGTSLLGSGDIQIAVNTDSSLSTTSTNPVQNKVVTAALNDKLDVNIAPYYIYEESDGTLSCDREAVMYDDLQNWLQSARKVYYYSEEGATADARPVFCTQDDQAMYVDDVVDPTREEITNIKMISNNSGYAVVEEVTPSWIADALSEDQGFAHQLVSAKGLYEYYENTIAPRIKAIEDDINSGLKGDPAVSYQLLVSHAVYNENTAKVTMGITKSVGSTVTNLSALPTGWKIKVSWSGNTLTARSTTYSAFTNINPNAATGSTSVTIDLYDGDPDIQSSSSATVNLIDSKTLLLVKNGTKGDKGDAGDGSPEGTLIWKGTSMCMAGTIPLTEFEVNRWNFFEECTIFFNIAHHSTDYQYAPILKTDKFQIKIEASDLSIYGSDDVQHNIQFGSNSCPRNFAIYINRITGFIQLYYGSFKSLSFQFDSMKLDKWTEDGVITFNRDSVPSNYGHSVYTYGIQIMPFDILAVEEKCCQSKGQLIYTVNKDNEVLATPLSSAVTPPVISQVGNLTSIYRVYKATYTLTNNTDSYIVDVTDISDTKNANIAPLYDNNGNLYSFIKRIVFTFTVNSGTCAVTQYRPITAHIGYANAHQMVYDSNNVEITDYDNIGVGTYTLVCDNIFVSPCPCSIKLTGACNITIQKQYTQIPLGYIFNLDFSRLYYGNKLYDRIRNQYYQITPYTQRPISFSDTPLRQDQFLLNPDAFLYKMPTYNGEKYIDSNGDVWVGRIICDETSRKLLGRFVKVWGGG